MLDRGFYTRNLGNPTTRLAEFQSLLGKAVISTRQIKYENQLQRTTRRNKVRSNKRQDQSEEGLETEKGGILESF